MKASNFFKTEIKDNKIFPNAYDLKCIETGAYKENFNCEIKRETKDSPWHRKQGIIEFLFDIHNIIGSKEVSELEIIRFDEEFDANTK